MSILYQAHRAGGADFVDVGGALVPRTFGDPTGEYLALRREAGVADLSHLTLVQATGPDRLTFLQSLLSQDLSSLEGPGQVVRSLLLEPRGKIQLGLQVFSLDDRVVLASESAAVEAALRRWRIRVKVDLEPAPFGLLEVRGPAAAGHEGAHDDWPGVPGRLRLVPADDVERVWDDLRAGVRPVGWEAREAVRVEAGIPRIGEGLDADERTIPQEAFLDRTHVSFTKGCFIGQELVCRIDTRGHVNRYLRGIVVGDTVRPPVGAAIVAGGKAVGVVTSVAESLDLRAPVCLGYVRREVEPPAPVQLQWDGGSATAEVRVLPLIGDASPP